APMEVLLGEEIMETIVSENGLKYHVQLGKSQNTGLFLDMANGRSWVRRNTENKRVLNLFSYTCAFSVAALAGGATYVVNFDNNKSVLKKGRDNHRLNSVDIRSANFENMNILKSFGRIRKHGPYDLLICDPPSFQKGSVDIRKDYRKILNRLPEFMNDNAKLMLCLNSPGLTEDFIHDMMAEELPKSSFLESIPTPDVFKEAMDGKGLKVLIYQFCT
ncbi:MAG: class I SAM-dependent methyltransferase, partial [Gammaproteobacteria bacterium]|nr:class I SAM-dependent methyltransferase [Gammaproteobacteria bacterium]